MSLPSSKRPIVDNSHIRGRGWVGGSIVANPIICRLVPCPPRLEIRQWREIGMIVLDNVLVAVVVILVKNRELYIGGRGRLPVRVFRTEHAHKVWPPSLEVRVRKRKTSYSESSSSDLKVPNVCIGNECDYENNYNLYSFSKLCFTYYVSV